MRGAEQFEFGVAVRARHDMVKHGEPPLLTATPLDQGEQAVQFGTSLAPGQALRAEREHPVVAQPKAPFSQ